MSLETTPKCPTCTVMWLEGKFKRQNASHSEARLLYQGTWYCTLHVPDRGWQERCSHTWKQPERPCTWCGWKEKS